MDLGISGRTATVMGSGRGLGRACAQSLAGEGTSLVVNGRSATCGPKQSNGRWFPPSSSYSA